jgi:hypothetical protein
MFKVVLAVILLIALAMFAGVYFGFNPALIILAILGVGFYLVSNSGGPAPPASNRFFGLGYGIYTDADDSWIAGDKAGERSLDDSGSPGADEDVRNASR